MTALLTPGRIVHYVLSAQDVEEIQRMRRAETHIGNPSTVGDHVPAIVVWPHDNEQHTFNGQAFLDGNDVLWVTSVPFDDNKGPRTWHWPEVVS